MHPSHLLSVDLGTSHAVALLRWPDGRVRPLLFDGQPVLPAGVYCDEGGDLHTGRDAARLAAAAPERYEPHPKRHAATGAVLLGDRETTVTAMFAAVLRRIAAAAADVAGTVPETILTCPSTWSSTLRGVLADAAAKAGLPPVAITTEPVAAAHYYRAALGRPIGGALAVVDFGAGTLDIAVLAADGDRLDIVAEGGLGDFGGVDLDAAVVEHLGALVAADHPDAWAALAEPATSEQRRARAVLWDEAREAKEMLSRTAVAPLTVPGVTAGLHLTRHELDRLARPLLEPAVAELARLRDRAAARGHRLDAVFLIGGAARMPLIATMVHEALGIAPVLIEQPELAVAEGAATPGLPGSSTAPEQAAAPADPPTAILPPPPARSGPRRRHAVAATAAALAVLAAVVLALVYNGGPEGDGPAQADFTVAPAQGCPEDAAELVPAAGVLRGPHFTVETVCLAFLEPDQTALIEALPGDVPGLEDDERLALAYFPNDGTALALPEGTAYDVAATLVLGGATWELDDLPAPGTVYAAAVGADDPLTLAVTDADRTQVLDLRTAAIADPVTAYYSGEFAQREFMVGWDLSFESTDGEWTGTATDDDIAVTAVRAAFDEEEGWLCESDLAVVTFTWAQMIEDLETGVEIPFDASEHLRVNARNEDHAPVSVQTSDEEVAAQGDDHRGIARTFTAVFAVPGDAVEMTVAYTPPDSYHYTGEGEDVWLYAQGGNETLYEELDFTPPA
ncbi:Hsp70 family protein [Glycomyces sp. NPDC047010]|uniref:Hsp70 family protein n=1 Tax=Glycomyces sp. NPDC047010 TaxID=3155023 RepID=UPI0033D22C06